MNDLLENPYSIQNFPEERTVEAPTHLINAIHAGAGHQARQATLRALGISNDQVPAGFRLYAKCNEDVGSGEIAIQVAQDLTDPAAVDRMIEAGYLPANVRDQALEKVSSNTVTVLRARNSRTVLDGNRFSGISGAEEVTGTMHGWVQEIEEAKQKGLELLEALHRIERGYIEQVLKGWEPGMDWRVFYPHTYSPRGVSISGDTEQEQYDNLAALYQDHQQYEAQHLRTEGQSFVKINRTETVIGPADIAKYLRDNFERIGLNFPADSEYAHYPNLVPASEYSQKHPGAFVMTETRRDLLLPPKYRSPGGFRQQVVMPDSQDIPIDLEQNATLALPISAALLLNSIRRGMKH